MRITRLAIITLAATLGPRALAAAPTTSPAPAIGESDTRPFGLSTYVTELAANSPQLDTQNRYNAGRMHPVFGYRRLIGDEWVMGLMVNYKILEHRDSDSELPILALSHESMRILRLWHPVYLLGGFKWNLMIPTRGISWPIRRSDQEPKQFGVALTATIQARVTAGWVLLARFDRWRGTADSHFHGIEYAFGIGRNI